MGPSFALPSRASLRSASRRGSARVRGAGLPILQTAGAAGAAWWLALQVLPEPHPVFAPLAAIIALGTTRGERGRRALQVALGVSLGIGAAGAGVRLLGSGPLQLALLTGLALLLAVFFFETQTLVVQAGVSAALVVAVGAPDVGLGRFLEALLGGVVALVVSQGLFPVDAVGRARGEIGALLARVADGLDRATVELGEHDAEHVGHAARAISEAQLRRGAIDQAFQNARESVRVSRPSRSQRAALARLEDVPGRLVRVIGKAEALVDTTGRLRPSAGESSDDGEGNAREELVAALEALADLTRRLAEELHRDPEELLPAACEATRHATCAARADPRPSVVTAATLSRGLAQALLELGGVPDPAAELARAADQVRAADHEHRD